MTGAAIVCLSPTMRFLAGFLHFACIFRHLPARNVGRLGASQMNHVSLALFHLSSTFELIYVKITHKHASVTAKQTERGLLPRHTHRR